MNLKVNNMDQWIVCAAIRHKHFDEIICGPRHYDRTMSQQIQRSVIKGWVDAEQGFVDQYGVFLTREDAREIAEKNNQIIRRCGGDSDKLFSENLY